MYTYITVPQHVAKEVLRFYEQYLPNYIPIPQYISIPQVLYYCVTVAVAIASFCGDKS